MKDDKREGTRIAIAAFIVATTFTVMATHFVIPKVLFIPAAAFMIGLIITAILAFLFILTKGYELRYGCKKRNLIDRYNHLLYNSAMTAYAIVAAILIFVYLYDVLNKASKAGDIFATFGVVALFIIAVLFTNYKGLNLLIGELIKRFRKQSKY